jgi:glycosyltransferase involved in cell wall biosynthesis
MVVIPNGVHVARFAAPPEHLPAKRGPTVLSVGVNKARKGFHVLLEAVAQARATLPAIQCVIIGSQADQAYTAQLRALVAAYGLADHVQLLGRVSEAALQGW